MFKAHFLAQEAAKTQDFTQSLIMIVVLMLAFYLILWRPEQKRRKALEQKKGSLQKGDRVVAVGIIGTVHKIQDNSIILNMVDGNKIEVLKNAISEVTPLNQAVPTETPSN